MVKRRGEEVKSEGEEMASNFSMSNAQNRQAAQHDQPLSELEQMMGLDEMGEMEIPSYMSGGGGGGMSEEEQMAAAIQASLSDMNLNAPADGGAEGG